MMQIDWASLKDFFPLSTSPKYTARDINERGKYELDSFDEGIGRMRTIY
jgi:hypothetical protein